MSTTCVLLMVGAFLLGGGVMLLAMALIMHANGDDTEGHDGS